MGKDEGDMAKEVHISHGNEGFSVLYPSLQRALRSNFPSVDAATQAVADWNRSGDFQLAIVGEVVDMRYDVDEERAKMGLKPLAEDRDGQYYVDHILALVDLADPTPSKRGDPMDRLDLDSTDATSIAGFAGEAMRLISETDQYRPIFQQIIDYSSTHQQMTAVDALKMLKICRDEVDALDVGRPGMK